MRFGKNKQEWHRWFAWHPVRIFSTRKWVWLETVERICYPEPFYNRYKLLEKQPEVPSHMQDSWENGI